VAHNKMTETQRRRRHVTSPMLPGSGRAAAIQFGWRMPMWDPDGTPAATWLPDVRSNLDQLRGSFDSVWLSDHLLPGATWMGPDTDTLECWTATASFATAYPEYTFGQVVMCSAFRHAPLLAKMTATLHLLTGGRLILGLGAGWMEREFRSYGYPYETPAARLANLAEAVQVIRRLWTRAPASFAGKRYAVDQAYCLPLPSPPPPIMLGVAGEQVGLPIVARHADWWNLHSVSAAEYARKAHVLEQHCAAAGRDPTSILYTWECPGIAIAESEPAARAIAERSTQFRHAAPEGVLVGTPDQVVARLREYVATGVRHFILRFLDFPDPAGAMRFAGEVAPQLR
jgi:alkanesulfonate monooxygenase SsuD/methylene tetrahydromethanopterin reductase-like flavin-dependent oxidoreductase (luciferase family)